jgi:hypothetical protein
MKENPPNAKWIPLRIRAVKYFHMLEKGLEGVKGIFQSFELGGVTRLI